jgi:hypothetical protein
MSRLLGFLLGLSVFVAACGSSDIADSRVVAATLPPEPITTVSPMKTLPPPTASTTLSQVVRAPSPPETFHFVVSDHAVISEPGATNVEMSITVEGESVEERLAYSTESWFGGRLHNDTENVIIDDEAWERSSPKPWFELDGFERISVKSDLPLTDHPRDQLYSELSERDWQIEERGGVTVRHYSWEVEDPGELGDWFGTWMTGFDDAISAQIDVYIDAESNDLIGAEVSMSGGASFFSGFTEEGTTVDRVLSMEFTSIGADLAEIEPPNILVSDTPEGFFLFEKDDFGFRLLLPLDWYVLTTDDGFESFAVPLTATPESALDQWVYVTVEDLTGTHGLRVEEYADLNIDSVGYDSDGWSTHVSEATSVGDLPAWLTETNFTSALDDYTVRMISIIDDNRGYILEFHGYNGDFDRAAAEEIFETFELYEPDASSSA